MKSRWERADGPPPIARVGLALVPAAVSGVLYRLDARPRIEGWGATEAEKRDLWPGDAFVPRPGFTWTNAITIDRAAEQVWPWVTQLGQGRAGLYSYDWLESLLLAGIRSADRILPEHQQELQTGDQVVRMARYAPPNPVALYLPGRALVLGAPGDATRDLRAGRASSTWAFIVQPVDASSCRLVVRSRGGTLAAHIQGPFQFVMQRRTMQGIKQRAEGTWSPSPADVVVPLTWIATGLLFAAAVTRLLRSGADWRRNLAVATASPVLLEQLMFREPPPAVALGAVVAVFAGLSGRFPKRVAGLGDSVA